MQLNTSKCPGATKPLASGAPILVGNTLSESGATSAVQAIGGMQAYFDGVNAAGGIDGHQLKVISADDGFDPSRAAANLTQFIEQDHIFFVGLQEGSSNILGTQQLIDSTCTPRLWVPAGLPQFGDPLHHPWTTTEFLAYNVEAGLWAKYIEQKFPQGAKVAMINNNNDQGNAYTSGFQNAIKGTNIQLVSNQPIPASAVSAASQVTASLAAKPDVIIGGVGGTGCTTLMTTVAQGGFTGTLILDGTCEGVHSFFAPAGAAANGVLLVVTYKDPSDPTWAQDPDVVQYKAAMAKYEPNDDPNSTLTMIGYRGAAVEVENLKRAAAMSGGLTQANLMRAAWTTDYAPPMTPNGVKFDLNGVTNGYAITSGAIYQYDASKKSMADTGLTVSVPGSVYTP